MSEIERKERATKERPERVALAGKIENSQHKPTENERVTPTKRRRRIVNGERGRAQWVSGEPEIKELENGMK